MNLRTKWSSIVLAAFSIIQCNRLYGAEIADKVQNPQQNTDGPSTSLSKYQKNTFLPGPVFDLIKPSVRQKLCQNDQKIFDEIAFYFPDDANILRVRAGREGTGRRAVEVSNGYLNFSSLLIQAAVYSSVNSKYIPPNKQWPYYIDYVADTLRYQSKPVEPGLVAATPQSFYTWAGIPLDDFAKFVAGHQEPLKSLLLEAFVFSVLHEVGHHVLGHPLTTTVLDERSREQEWAADLYALAGLSRHKLSTFGAIPYFMLHSRLEIDLEEPAGSHDPSACRLLFLLDPNIGIKEIEQKRGIAAQVCGRDLQQIRTALASKDSAVCFRP